MASKIIDVRTLGNSSVKGDIETNSENLSRE